MTKLTSIPPANRRPNRLSSMRATTRIGMTFVGGHVGPAAQSRAADSFKVHTVEPNTARIKVIQEYRAAIREKIQWLEEQALHAANADEEAWWKAQLVRIENTLGLSK